MKALFNIDGVPVEPMSKDELDLFMQVFGLDEKSAQIAQAMQYGKIPPGGDLVRNDADK